MIGLRFRSCCELLSDIVQPTTECRRLLVPTAAAKRNVVLTTLDEAKRSDESSCNHIVCDERPRCDAHAKSSDCSLKHEVEVLKLGHIPGSYFDARQPAPVHPGGSARLGPQHRQIKGSVVINYELR